MWEEQQFHKIESPSQKERDFDTLQAFDFLSDWQKYLRTALDGTSTKNQVDDHVNHWWPKTNKSGSRATDIITLTAEQTVTADEFYKQNPAAPKPPGSGDTDRRSFKLRHPTTGEVDDGWHVAGVKDGKVKLLRDYQMEVQHGDHGGLIELRPGIPADFGRHLQKKLDQLPQNVLKNLQNAGYKIIAADTISEAMPSLKQLTPRGWAKDLTFDDSDGTHDNISKRIIAPRRVRGEKGEAPWVPVTRDEVVVHQIGHALDFANNFLSQRKEFLDAYKKDMSAAALNRDNPTIKYLSQPNGVGEQETFATLFGLVLTGPENEADKEFLERTFPETIKVVKQQIENLPPRKPR